MSTRFYDFFCGFIGLIYSLFLPCRPEGLEHIPAEGGFILCCNHISARDPFFIAVRVKNRRLRFMAKAELFRNKLLGRVLSGLGAFPVDRGHSDLNAIRTAMKTLGDGHALGLFPQGTRSRDNRRTPMLNGVSMIALRAQKPVIPAYIGGPYRLFRRTPLRFGPPVKLDDLGRRMDNQTLTAATQRIEEAVWDLAREP